MKEDDTNTTIGARIRLFRQTFSGISTQSAFAEALGVDQQRLSGYENGTKVPHTIIATMVRFGANPHWLLFGEGSMRTNAAEGEAWRQRELRAVVAQPNLIKKLDSTLPEFCILPLYADESAIAMPPDARDIEVEGPAVVHSSWCPHPSSTDCLRVASSGVSMQPTIPAGAMVTVDRTQTDPNRLEGKIVAIGLREGGVTLKRLRRTKRGDYIGMPDNPESLPICIEEGDRILGIVQTIHARID